MHSYIYTVCGNLIIMKERCLTFLKSFVPCQVHEVKSFSEGAGTARTLYKAGHLYSRWIDAYQDTMYAGREAGYYAIDVWDSQRSSHDSYFLSSHHLCKALGLRSLHSWWTMSDFGMVQSLSTYVRSMKHNKQKIFAIMIDGKDAMPVLRRYVDSLGVHKNVTAEAVCTLYHHLCGKRCEENSLVLVDFDLNESAKRSDEYLFDD